MRQEPGTVAPSHRQPDGEVPRPRHSPRRATERMYQENDGGYSQNWTLWQIYSEEQQKKSNRGDRRTHRSDEPATASGEPTAHGPKVEGVKRGRHRRDADVPTLR